jgi:hypothetical protein
MSETPVTPPASDAAPHPAGQKLDKTEISGLVAALKSDLDALREVSGPERARLEQEVAELSALLKQSDADHELPERLSRLHGLLNKPEALEVEVDALETARYVTAIGRILGLA